MGYCHGYFFKTEEEKIEPTVATRMQLYKNEALPLAATAIKAALAKTSLQPADFTHLITVSCTGMYAPGIDIELVETMGFRTEIERTNINFMGCYAAFNALKTARYIVEANPAARVLVVCVELCTIHYQDKTDADTLLANALFGDGAAAAVISMLGFCAGVALASPRYLEARAGRSVSPGCRGWPMSPTPATV